MDWLRRNWPDLLIGIALVAVIAGIIATLITGGSFFPVGQNSRTSTPASQNSTTQTAPPASGSSASSSNPGSAGKSASGSQSGASPQSSPAAGGGQSGGAPAGGGVSVLPPNAGASSAGGGAAGASPAAGAASSGSASASAASGSQASAAGSGPGAAAPYRISVGAFSQKDNAQHREQTFKQAGYPVFLASQGDLTIVLVGPYKSQAEAEQVAKQIKNGGYGVEPVVYQFQGSNDQAPQAASSGSASSAASGGAQPAAGGGGAAASGGAAVQSGMPTAPSGEHYLQVGAYETAASAKPQRDRLEGMGFTVHERSEGGLVKLLIGPFGPDRLQQVRSQLTSAGIDNFPR